MNEQRAGTALTETAEAKLEEFAEDLGRLLGNAKVKAQGWMDQRTAIAEHLTGLRDTANQLLQQLGIGGSDAGAGSSGGRRPGRPRKQQFTPPAEAVAAPKKRTMSAEARARISAAQRLRWAKQKRAASRG